MVVRFDKRAYLGAIDQYGWAAPIVAGRRLYITALCSEREPIIYRAPADLELLMHLRLTHSVI